MDTTYSKKKTNSIDVKYKQEKRIAKLISQKEKVWFYTLQECLTVLRVKWFHLTNAPEVLMWLS